MRKRNDHPPARGTLPRSPAQVARAGALSVVVAITGAATVAAVIESYVGLHEWARRHEYVGHWGVIWPLLIDTPIVAGELMLLVAFIDGWSAPRKILPWALTVVGLATSVEANFYHLRAASLPTRATSAAAPLVACVMLASTLVLLKWTTARPAAKQASTPRPAVTRTSKRRAPARARDERVVERLRALIAAGETVPSVREIARTDLGNVNLHRRAKRLLEVAQQNGHAA